MKTSPPPGKDFAATAPRGGLRLSLFLSILALAPTLPAADPAAADQSFADLSIEELMNETVTSVSKKEQRLGDAAAAISVVTNDDIRRSGSLSLAEALRLVPGLAVASVNASQTAVSARGFNSLYANKLLVLVDGRSVYGPLFAGVYWDSLQITLEDLDRIEVIRGPGATIWGANAVSGVINVVSRSARETQGGLLYAGGGDGRQTRAGVRYGGRLDERTYYRIYGSEQSHGDHPLADGQPALDRGSGRQAGLRVDHYPTEQSHLMWQTELTASDLLNHETEATNFNTIGRWTQNRSDRAGVELQVYYDRTRRNDSFLTNATIDTLDFSLQHRLGLGERHDVIWGLGSRYVGGNAVQSNPYIAVRQGKFSQRIFSAFAQDEIKLAPDRLMLTLGTKLEHNNYTGFEIQPNVRLAFKPTERQTLWAAVSRAVRTPTVVEGTPTFAGIFGAPFPGPDGGLYVPTLVGDPGLTPEKLWAYELGWRIQPVPRVSVDTALFYDEYQDLISIGSVPRFVPGAPVGAAELPWSNGLASRTYGGECSVTVAPSDTWRVTAAYSLLVTRVTGDLTFADPRASSDPKHQFSLRSAYDFSPRLSLDGLLRHVGPIQGVPAYLTADLRFSYRPNARLEFALVGKNLTDSRHPEQVNVAFSSTAEVPRSFYAQLTWRN